MIEHKSKLNNLLAITKVRYLIQDAFTSFLFGLICYPWLTLLHWSVELTFFSSGLIVLVILILKISNSKYRALELTTLLEHFNRQLPEYEESGQLLLSVPEKLTLLQKLQREKISLLINEDLKTGKLKDLLPKINWRMIIALILTAISSFVLAFKLVPLVIERQESITEIKTDSIDELNNPPQLTYSKIIINPPEYTGLPTRKTKDLSLEIVEGSKVTWQLQFDQASHDYFITSGEDSWPLQASNGHYEYSQLTKESRLYHLTSRNSDGELKLPGVYPVSVIKDQVPKIRILEPLTSLIEIDKTATAEFTLKANIKDDYGLGEITILASVAKGSGEAVKFRDQAFKFDKSQPIKGGLLLEKHWKLTDLQMEPGDEVYFSIQANDNKQPNSQLAKSSSIIVRWLDDEEVELAAEGIQIRFIPEYFRSQRQIIVETERLIADKNDLDKNQFEETSLDLGYSQRDLKEKYGQYLGDEFGEGPGEQFGLADGYHGGEDVAAGEATAGLAHDDERHDDHHEEHKEQAHNEPIKAMAQQTAEVGHSHGLESSSASLDKSGAAEIIEEFTHKHIDMEVGPLSGQDPKSWMKKAVSTMWQAELHLMMSEPEKALPFEYEAYRYLKLARQAERIYVKRLGFEPPPVKESARYTGELDDILSYSISEEALPDQNPEQELIRKNFVLLTTTAENKKLTAAQKGSLQALKNELMKLAENRPILVSYAAIVERILVNGDMQLTDCDSCIKRLKSKLWQLASKPKSLPLTLTHSSFSNKSARKKYLERLENWRLESASGSQP